MHSYCDESYKPIGDQNMSSMTDVGSVNAAMAAYGVTLRVQGARPCDKRVCLAAQTLLQAQRSPVADEGAAAAFCARVALSGLVAAGRQRGGLARLRLWQASRQCPRGPGKGTA